MGDHARHSDPFDYIHNELVWRVDAVSEFGERALDGVVASSSLVTRKSHASTSPAPLEFSTSPFIRKLGHKKVDKANSV